MTSLLRLPSALLVCTAFASACANGESPDAGRRDAPSIDAPPDQIDVFVPGGDTGRDVGSDVGSLPDMGMVEDTGPAPVDAFVVPVDVGNDVGRDSGPSCVDRDGDGAFIGPASCGPIDCDDTQATRRPGAAELCNGVDDNCNSAIDDGIAVQVCGTGVCLRTVPGCTAGSVPTCTPAAPGTETCNTLDDNCDGLIDNGIPAISCGVATCARTVPACVSGVPQACTPGAPGTEVCNGADDDCDTVIDDGFGTVTCGTGACRRTINSCMAGVPQSCVAGPPASEVCNGSDDNCDGVIDNDLGMATCGVGLCTRTVSNCISGVPQSCVPGTAVAEICGNGMDENCNGSADDACAATGDLCSSPIAIDTSLPTTTITGNTTGVGAESTSHCCSAGPDLFYSFTLTRTEYVYASTLGLATWDTSLYFTDGGCTPLAARSLPELVCDDDGGPNECGSLQSQAFAILTPGTYRLVVDGCGSGSGAFSVNFAHYPVGSVGNGGALAAGSSTVTGSLPAAAGASPATCLGTGAERSYYWLTCPTTGGGTLTATTCSGTSFDTYLAAYHSNTTQSCADDTCGTQTTITQSLPTGAAFHVLYMDAYNSASTGTYTLTTTRP